MPKKISEIRRSILKPVPTEHLKDRAGPGNKRLHYVEGDYVTYQLNEIFGVECVDITVPHHGLEGENRFLKAVEGKAAFNKETRKYEPTETTNVPAIEFSYGAKVRIAVTVLDEQNAERVFVKEGIGAGLGSSAATEFSSLHQARQIAMKYAETDALKRAAKKIGTLFGLSIGEDGRQAYAIDDDSVEEIVAPEVGATTPTPSAVLSNESTTAAAPQPVKETAATTAVPAPKAAAPAPAPTPVANQAQQQAHKAPAATPAAQTPVNVQQAPKTSAPAPAAERPAPTPAAAELPAQVEPAEITLIAIPDVNEDALRAMSSGEWTTTFRNLKDAMTQRTSIEDVSEVARVAGCYFRLVSQSDILDVKYKTQVKPLMTSHLDKHVKAHALQIDLAAEIKKGEEPAERVEEEAFQAPF
jgi:hypothetical protein